MISANLQLWIQHPEMLNRDTLYELRNLLARYPYFQSLRLLYLKNLYILHDATFGAELRKCALYIADRKQLFYLIEGAHFSTHSHKLEVEQPLEELDKAASEEDRTLTLIDAFLSTVPEEVSAQTGLDYPMEYSSYCFLKAETDGADEKSATDSPPLRGQNLIDDFIEKSEGDFSLCVKSVKVESEVESEEEEEEEEEEEWEVAKVCDLSSVRSNVEQEEDDDSCFTETLAKIYVKQRRYLKAIEIIKKLSLKYPKKNAYFADQIRFLEKLIINANSK